MEAKKMTRGAGVLLAITSLPSAYGIGTLGYEAFRFVDLLANLKQKYWQVLPIGPTSFGDSPYQPVSAFAGNPYMIDLDALVEDGLLSLDEIRSIQWETDETEIDYALIYQNRYRVLKDAFDKFDVHNKKFLSFQKEQEYWLDEYALYMAIKHKEDERSWLEWDLELRSRDEKTLETYRKILSDEICFWKFCQYEFYTQWDRLKEYAAYKGISLIGDVSLYVGLDSVDVWANQKMFLLQEDGTPSVVAAAVPDQFSQEGQVWGNPIYDWNYAEKHEFIWWKKRIANRKKMFDFIRFDHFLGIVKEYTVPYQTQNAQNGKWMKGPGRKLVKAINEVCDCDCIIADDYGGKTFVPGAKKILEKAQWPGIKVLMFAFDGDPTNEHLPHNYPNDRYVVYAGTHDNETIAGHFENKTEYELAYLYTYLNIDKKEDIPDALIRCAYASTAKLAIIQMQDMLKLGNEARMNAPTTIGYNWRWRMIAQQLSTDRLEWIRNLVAVYYR